MTPHAVAAAPKDLAPPRTPQAASADGDFAQLVADIGRDAPTSQAVNDHGDPASAPDRATTKAKSDDTGGAKSAAAAALPASPPPTMRALPAATASGDTCAPTPNTTLAAPSASNSAPAGLPLHASHTAQSATGLPSPGIAANGPAADGGLAPPVAGTRLGAAASQGEGDPYNPVPTEDRAKTKDQSDHTSAAASAAAAASPQTVPAITAAAASGETQVPAPNTALAAFPGSGSTTAAPNAASSGDANPPSGAAAPTARVVAGAPNYSLLLNGALVGLWYHIGDAAQPTMELPSSSTAGDAPVAANGDRAPPVAGTLRDAAASQGGSEPYHPAPVQATTLTLAASAANPPSGAATLNARVVAGAPNYLSQPSSALSGLWHHAADIAQPATAPSSAGDTATAPAADSDPGNAAQDSALAQAGAAVKDAITTQPQAAPGVDGATSIGGLAAGNGAEALDGGSPSGAITVALPGAATAPTASAASTASTPPPPIVIPAVAQVALNLAHAAQNGTGRIEIQLKPASLGTIAVKLDVTHDGRITAVISADRSDTLNLLRQDSGTLQQALRDAGLQADSGSLSFNLRGDPQAFAQNAAPTRGNAVPAATPVAAVAARIDIARSRRHGGALDIEV